MNETEKIKVLYIDDELNNLNSFKASYRYDYKIYTAINAEDALEILKSEPDLEIILSDQRMPGTTGVEFFESIRYDFPKPVRMLLTGYTDIEDVVDAINKGHIFRYIRKPWMDGDIQSAIEEAHKYYMASSKLVERNQSLQKAYHELEQFAYRVTHDLKGPIINSMAALDVLKNEESAEARSEIVGLIMKSLSKLNDFVDNMFSYYRIRLGETAIQKIDFEQLLQAQIDIFGVTLKMHHIRFEKVINQKMPFMSDDIKCSIIIANLLSNAFKYQRKDNPDKWVKLSVDVYNGEAVIKVSDNGIGIDEQHQKNIFDLFYRATTSEPGSGIGLYNVYDAVLKLNGKINVESELGKGTTFILSLPSIM